MSSGGSGRGGLVSRLGPSRPSVRRGVGDALPLIASYVPFGLILGATIATSDVPDLPGWLSSALIFAGASQLAAVDLLDADAVAAVVIATALVINLRHVMYSGALAPRFREQSKLWQFAAPYLLADPVYTFSAIRFEHEITQPAERRAYYLSLGVTLWVGWQVLTGAGILVGAVLPESWPLDLAVPLTFLALVAPAIVDRATAAAAVVGGVTAVLARDVALHLGLMVGALAGTVAGMVAERWVETAETEHV